MEQFVTQYQEILDREQERKRQQLDDYRARLITLAERHARARPAPRKPLTVPAIFGRSHDENFISDYLAYVLDPSKNGIGEGPRAAPKEINRCRP